MRLALVTLAAVPVLAVASSVSAQSGATSDSGDAYTPPLQSQSPFLTQYPWPERYDDKTTRIDRRNSARFQAAKIARKARERAEREVRQPDRG